MPERLKDVRRNDRVSCVMPAVAQLAGEATPAVCRTVSREGAFLTSVGARVGQRLHLTLELPALGAIEAEAQVRYEHQHPDGDGVGVVFTSLADEHRLRLDRFISLFRAPVAP